MRIVNPTAILGEDVATKYLSSKGYKILDRNYSKRYGEIDIVAKKQNTLVFVEVKTRSSEVFGTALEAITSWKLKQVIKTAEYYKLTHAGLPDLMRVDAISVMLNLDNTVQNIEHIENISGF